MLFLKISILIKVSYVLLIKTRKSFTSTIVDSNLSPRCGNKKKIVKICLYNTQLTGALSRNSYVNGIIKIMINPSLIINKHYIHMEP
jgi:hypothetical protein